VVVEVEVHMLIVDLQLEDLVEQVVVELELLLLHQVQLEQRTVAVVVAVVEMEVVHYLLVEMAVQVW
tara:strand:+ start:438 stop:638 length:201 start_codon:yes stop_codon:yes gene_type:complete